MQHIINKPYLLFWGLIPIVLIIGISRGHDMIDINVHDTYFVIATSQMWYFVSALFGILGFGYWILLKYKRKLSNLMNIIHIIFTITGLLGIWISRRIYAEYLMNSNMIYPEGLSNFNLISTILIMLLVFGQLIYILNTILSIFRKSDKTSR